MEVKDLKVGDEITLDGNKYVVKSIEKSKVAKHGKAKVRLVLDCNGAEKIIVRLESDEV